MKKSILFLSFLLFAALFARGSDTKEVRLTFDGSDFSFAQENGAYSISAEKFPVIYDTDTLAPALPYYVVNVLIAPTQEFQGLTVRGGESLLRSDIRVTPNKLPVPTNALDAYTPNRVFDYALSNYPSEEVRYVSTNVLGNYKYVSLLVCPLRYDAQNHSLYLKQNLQITLSLGTVSKAAPIAAYPESESFHAKKRREIELLVYNSDDIDALYPTAARQNSIANSFPVKYLVITNEELKPAFQRLANWKTTKGVKSKVLTVEEISQKYSDPIMPMRIKRAIMEYKGQVEYVLLGGDVEIVPSLMCPLGPLKDSPTVDVPADLYYSCFTHLNWDNNQNGLYGEDSDWVSYTADIAVSRLSVCKMKEATSIVNKLIKYEMSPGPSEISDTLLMCGNFLYHVDTIPLSPGDTLYVSDSQKYNEELYQDHIAPYWNGSRMRFFDTFTDFEEGDRYHVSPLHMQEQLSRGYFLVNEFSHGWIDAWGGLEGRDTPDAKYTYENDLAETLINPNYTTIVSGACCVNWFDREPDSLCLSEAFMRNENSNILAFVGYSREGFVGAHCDLMKYFYDGIFKYKMSTAEAVSYAKNRSAAWRWPLLALNTLGDPEGHLYLSKPKRFEDVRIDYKNNRVDIAVSQDSCHVCLTKIDDKGNVLFYRFQNLQGNVFSFEQIPNEFTVCVTKDGFVPYCVNVLKQDDGNLYLQNVTFDGNTTVVGKKIIAGRDVKRGSAQGPVRILNGNVSLQAEQTVRLKNSFRVEKGASLQVHTNLK